MIFLCLRNPEKPLFSGFLPGWAGRRSKHLYFFLSGFCQHKNARGCRRLFCTIRLCAGKKKKDNPVVVVVLFIMSPARLTLIMPSKFFQAHVDYMLPFIKDNGVPVYVYHNRLRIAATDGSSIAMVSMSLNFSDTLFHEFIDETGNRIDTDDADSGGGGGDDDDDDDPNDESFRFEVCLNLVALKSAYRVKYPHVRLRVNADLKTRTSGDKIQMDFGTFESGAGGGGGGGGRHVSKSQFKSFIENAVPNLDIRTPILCIPPNPAIAVAFVIDSMVLRKEVFQSAKKNDVTEIRLEASTAENQAPETVDEARERAVRERLLGKRSAPVEKRFVPHFLVFQFQNTIDNTLTRIKFLTVNSYQQQHAASHGPRQTLDPEPAWKRKKISVQVEEVSLASDDSAEGSTAADEDLDDFGRPWTASRGYDEGPCRKAAVVGRLTKISGIDDEEEEEEQRIVVTEAPPDSEDDEDAAVPSKTPCGCENDDEDDADKPIVSSSFSSSTSPSKASRSGSKVKKSASNAADAARFVFGNTVDLRVFKVDTDNPSKPPDPFLYSTKYLCNVAAGTMFNRQALVEILAENPIIRISYRTGKDSFISCYLAPKIAEK